MKNLTLKYTAFSLLSILSTTPAYADCPQGQGFIFDSFVGPKVSRNYYVSVVASKRGVSDPQWCINPETGETFTAIERGSFHDYDTDNDIIFECGKLRVKFIDSWMSRNGWSINRVDVRTKTNSHPWLSFYGQKGKKGEVYVMNRSYPEGIDKNTGRYSTRYVMQRLFFPSPSDFTDKILTVTTVVRSKSVCEKPEIF